MSRVKVIFDHGPAGVQTFIIDGQRANVISDLIFRDEGAESLPWQSRRQYLRDLGVGETQTPVVDENWVVGAPDTTQRHGGPYCMTVGPSDHRWNCTRERDHSGVHVAGNGASILEVWQ